MLSLSTPSKEDHRFVELTTGVYELDYSYDNVLRWFNLVESDLPDEVKATRTFLMFVGPVDATDEDIVKTLKTVSEDVSKHPYGNTVESDPVGKWDRAFDFDLDSGAIYASFMQTYHIDLLEEKGKMSWFKFKALLDGLDSESIFEKNNLDPQGRLERLQRQTAQRNGGLKGVLQPGANSRRPKKAKNDYEMQKQFEQMGLT
ncbi:MAG: hypothetical protein DQL93_0195 (endogenous virus) [Lactobacillus phage ViSo-2018b]|nr:MAG: hypothetical protein DQL93_0195 [Lactobacillus phage ViSo-2018b]